MYGFGNNLFNFRQKLIPSFCLGIYGYHGPNGMRPFLKITLAYPKLIAPTKRILEEGFTVPNLYTHRGYQTYESNIDFEIR